MNENDSGSVYDEFDFLEIKRSVNELGESTVLPCITAATADQGATRFNGLNETEAGRPFGHLHASGVEGLVSKLLLQGGHHSAGVQLPPVQEEAGMCSGVGDVSRNPFGLGVVRVAPRLVLPKKMHHLGVLTKPETRSVIFTFPGVFVLRQS